MKGAEGISQKKILKTTYAYIDIHIRLHARAHSFGRTDLLAHTFEQPHEANGKGAEGTQPKIITKRWTEPRSFNGYVRLVQSFCEQCLSHDDVFRILKEKLEDRKVPDQGMRLVVLCAL